MPTAAHASSAIFLVRVWLEDGELMRARIIENLDLVNCRDEIILVVGSASEIEHRVHSWLEQLSPPAVTPR
jgi:hypothetical protein